MVINLAN